MFVARLIRTDQARMLMACAGTSTFLGVWRQEKFWAAHAYAASDISPDVAKQERAYTDP